MKAKADEKKTYLLEMKNGGQKKVTVPAAWKVTFGPICPGANRNLNGEGALALRFYESKDNQRAVFANVIAFRDESIAVLEKQTRTKQQTMSKRSGSGFRDVVVEARVSEWADPDAPPKPEGEYFKLNELTGDEEI